MQHNSEHHREQEGQHQSRHRAQARQQSRCRARMPQVDDIMQHHAISHSRPHAQAQPHAAAPIAAGCSHHFPASKAEKSPQLFTANFAGRMNPREWACEMRNGPNPTHRVHARITTPLTQSAWAGRRHRAKESAPWVLGRLRSSVTRRDDFYFCRSNMYMYMYMSRPIHSKYHSLSGTKVYHAGRATRCAAHGRTPALVRHLSLAHIQRASSNSEV